MNPNLVTPENLSLDLLKAILEYAGLEIISQDDDRLHLRDRSGNGCSLINLEQTLRLARSFEVEKPSSLQAKLEMANYINNTIPFVRCSLQEDGALDFDYFIMMRGGVTRTALINAVEYFMWMPVKAMERAQKLFE